MLFDSVVMSVFAVFSTSVVVSLVFVRRVVVVVVEGHKDEMHRRDNLFKGPL